MSVTQMFGSNVTTSIFQKADTIEDIEKQVEALIYTSQKLEEFSLSLSLDAITQAYNLSVKNKKDELNAKCNHQLGIVHTKNGSTNKALASLKAALSYYEELSEKEEIALILVDIGNAYANSNQFRKSLIYYNSALLEYRKNNDSLGIAICYTKLGQSNNALGDNSVATKFFRDAINISLNNNYNLYTALNYLYLSKIQLDMGITTNIESQIAKAIQFAGISYTKYIEADAYFLLNQYYFNIGDKTEAATQINKYISLTDSLNKIKNIEFENFLIELSNVIDKPKEKDSIKFIYGILILILFIIILYILYIIKKQKSFYLNYIKKSKAELEAFDATTSNLEEKIIQKTNERFVEIKDETIKGKDDILALNESIKKLDQVNYLKDIFLSKISHEIRTPLSGILGFSSILETELALLEDPSLFEFANNISQSGSSLVTLLNNILDISRLDSNNMTLDIKKLATNELIQGIIDKYDKEASLKGIKLIFDSSDVPDIYTDNLVFSKILSLILDNSVKFTEKGFIKVSNSFDENTNIITILIKDTGIGIDKVYIDQVFEPYRQESLGYSTSYQGAGLGLPLAKKMTIKLEGEIDIKSEKGDGTTIILKFPVYQTNKRTTLPDKSNEKQIANQEDKPSWESLSILVVEDDNLNQILYRKMLQKARVLEIAKNGKTALNIIEKHIANNNFQVVLMDINLPEPWDGVSLMKEIRNRWPAYQNIPFIAQTAYAMSGNKEVMINEGFDDYITKPIIKSTLIKSINSVINI